MATAIFLMLSGNSMDFTTHTVEGDTYHNCLHKVLVELGSPGMWEVLEHEVVKGEFESKRIYETPVVINYSSNFDDDIPF